jgi:hypothetical protein
MMALDHISLRTIQSSNLPPFSPFTSQGNENARR